MAGALIAGAMALASISGLLLSGGSPPSLGSVVRHLPALGLRAQSVLREIGGSPLIGALLALRPVRELSMTVSERVSPLGVALDERTSAATLLAGAMLLSVMGGILFGSPVASLIVAAGLVGGMFARDSSLRERERREILGAMPGVYRTLSVALGSGQTLSQAVAYVGAHEHGAVARVFARMSLRLRCGTPTEEAVGLLARELSVPGADLLATALVISHRTGSPLRDLLLRSASLAEQQREFERTLSVKTAQVRLSVRIVCLLPAVMMGFLGLMSPDFQAGLATPAGIGCVTVAAVLDGAALLIIGRLMRGVL